MKYSPKWMFYYLILDSLWKFVRHGITCIVTCYATLFFENQWSSILFLSRLVLCRRWQYNARNLYCGGCGTHVRVEKRLLQGRMVHAWYERNLGKFSFEDSPILNIAENNNLLSFFTQYQPIQNLLKIISKFTSWNNPYISSGYMSNIIFNVSIL